MLLRNTLLATTALTLVVTPALAADVTYPAAPPPAGSPLYSPASLVTGDLSLAIGAVSGGGENLGAYEGTGRAALPLTGGFNLWVSTVAPAASSTRAAGPAELRARFT
jgi:hypothetical protein